MAMLPRMHARTLGLAALLLLAPALSAQAAVAAAKLLQRAEHARQRGDEPKATQLARECLALQPDDFAARSFLGFRWCQGRWRLPQEIAYLEQAAAKAAPAPPPAAPAPKPIAEAAALQRRLWSRDEREARQARAQLLELARSSAVPGVAAQVEREYRRARAMHAAYAVMTVQLQQVRLTGLDVVSVGFGAGTGRLMLPRTESVSFAGTVALPLGSGH